MQGKPRTKKRIAGKTRPLSRRFLRNIAAVYHSATDSERTEGLYWYAQAQRDAIELANKYSITPTQAIGVIAALSPGREWGLNLIDADKLIHAYVSRAPIPAVGSYGKKNINKALHILQGENPLDVLPLTGPKVRAFFSLILNPENDSIACVDRHAKAILFGRPLPESDAVRAFQFDFFARHYVQAARELGLLPHQVQAITWLAWRRAKAQDQLDEVPF